jgi:prepilin-type N-terminal cleavage/methylation domain-containing protein
MSCQPQQSASRKGFTLVEVLIVLVIISIMAGLLITVIDPVKQRNRARDGTIVATANKIVAAAQAYNSALGSYPNCYVLAGSGTSSEIQNTTALNLCSAASPGSGTFMINSLVTPKLCADAVGYSVGAANLDCKFRYGAAVVSGVSQACLGIKLNLPTDLNNDGTPYGWLIWNSTSGTISDEQNPTCAY